MNSFIKNKVNTNSFYSFFSKGFNLFIAFISAILVISIFNETEQGIYYFLLSLISLGLAAEAGLTMITSIAVTNELNGISKNSINKFYNLIFDNRSSMSSIIGFAYIAFFVLFLIFCLVIFLFFFVSDSIIGAINSKFFIYILIIIFLAYINLISQAILEGCGRVDLYQKMLIFANALGLIVFLTSVYFKEYLFAVLYQYGMRSVILFLCLNYYLSAWNFIYRLFKHSQILKYFKSIKNFQLRLSTSWIAGAIMYYSIVPIASISSDLKVGGQLGLCFQLFHAILGLGLSWQIGSQPLFVNLRKGTFLNFKKFVDLISYKCSITSASIALISVIGIYFYNFGFEIVERFGGTTNIIPLVFAAILLTYISPRTASIRAFKKDPFMEISLVTAAAVCIGTFYLSSMNLSEHIASLFLLIMIVQSVSIEYVFKYWLQNNFNE